MSNLRELREMAFDALNTKPGAGPWDSQEMDRLIHLGHMKLFTHVAEQMEDFCVGTANLTTVVDQADYDLPTDFYRLVWCRRIKGSDGATLDRPVPLERLQRDPWDVYLRTGGVPGYPGVQLGDAFYLTGQKKITLVRTPTAAITNELELRYVFRPARMSQDTHVPFQQTVGAGGTGKDNLEEFHDLIVWHATLLALAKEESPDRREFYQRQWQDRLAELKDHLDRINVHAPRFVHASDEDWESDW